MQEVTKEDILNSLEFIRKAKVALEGALRDSIHLCITEFYNKTGIPITDVLVSVTTANDLKGNTMSYVTDVQCRNDTIDDL